MPTLEKSTILPEPAVSRVTDVRTAMESLRASEGLLAMFGFVVQLHSIPNGVRLELLSEKEALGQIEVTYLDHSAILQAPVVEPRYQACGLEDGLRAVAVRLLFGHPVAYVEIR
jgi:hypothetical protein